MQFVSLNKAGQKIQTNVFIGHPAYDGVKIINDFAVGKVETPFDLNEYAKPIALVNPSETRPEEGHPLQTSGYGYYQLNDWNRPISQGMIIKMTVFQNNRHPGLQ